MVKENRIGGILVDVLHWASWADYIVYIGLTPHVDRQCGTIPIYSNRKQHYVASDTLWNEVTSKSLVRWPPSPWFLHPARTELVI